MLGRRAPQPTFCAAAVAFGGMLATLMIGCGAAAAPPRIQSVAPGTIVPGKTAVLLIGGQGFKDGASVSLGGTVRAARSTWVNATYMTAVLPGEISPAQYSVEVTNPDGRRAVSSGRVTVAAAQSSTRTPTPEPKATIPAATPTPTPASPTPTAVQTASPSPPAPATQLPGPPVIIPPPHPPRPGEPPTPPQPTRR